MYSKIKLFGNPVHPMLVAYPPAFSISTFVAYLVYPRGGNPFRFRAGVVGAGGPAILLGVLCPGAAGFLDWTLIRNEEVGMNAGCAPLSGVRRS